MNNQKIFDKRRRKKRAEKSSGRILNYDRNSLNKNHNFSKSRLSQLSVQAQEQRLIPILIEQVHGQDKNNHATLQKRWKRNLNHTYQNINSNSFNPGRISMINHLYLSEFQIHQLLVAAILQALRAWPQVYSNLNICSLN